MILWKLVLLAVAVVLPHQLFAAATAETSRFTANGSNIPTSAKTVFNEPLWTSGDAKNTTHHELLHAAGFTVAYSQFAAHVDGSRQSRMNRPPSGTVLAKLVPAGQGTHTDPNAGTVNGHNQANSLMQPNRKTGIRMGAQDESVLNPPFWANRKLSVSIVYVGTWTAAQKAHVEHAKTAAEGLFSSGSSTHNFTWTVEVNDTSSVTVPVADFQELFASLNSTSPETRIAGLRRLFATERRVAIEGLLERGARLISTTTPSPEDLALSVLSRDAAIPFLTDAIGLHTAVEIDGGALLEMGERHGFIAQDTEFMSPDSTNVIYADIATGRDLWEVIESVITEEPGILNVNLNYVEY